MTKLICDKKTFDVNKVKTDEYYPVWVFERIWKKAATDCRRLLRDLGLKPKKGKANGIKSEFYPYKSIAVFKKLFEENTDCHKSTIASLMLAMARKDKIIDVKEKPVRKPYKKREPKIDESHESEEDNVFDFIYKEAEVLGCSPKELNKSALRIVNSIYKEAEVLGCCSKELNKSALRIVKSGFYQTA